MKIKFLLILTRGQFVSERDRELVLINVHIGGGNLSGEIIGRLEPLPDQLGNCAFRFPLQLLQTRLNGPFQIPIGSFWRKSNQIELVCLGTRRIGPCLVLERFDMSIDGNDVGLILFCFNILKV